MAQSVTTLQPTIPSMRRILVLSSALVALAGLSLFVFSEQTDRFFAWTIQSHLTAAFLGAAYGASFVLEILAARQRAWARARSSVPAVLVFTILTLGVTLLHLDRFHFNAPELLTRAVTWLWLAIYIVVPVTMLVVLVRQWLAPGASPARQAPLPAVTRVLSGGVAVLALGAGLLLLLLPNQVAPVWPWPLTTLTARALGAWWIGLGLLSASDVWENDADRVRPIRVSAICFSLLQLLALARYPTEPDWGRWSMWVYLLFLIVFLGLGVYGVLAARRVQASAA